MSDSSKKRKKKYFGGGVKRSKYSLNLCPGLKGFLCTHNGHPKFCIRELYNMLDEFADSPRDKKNSDKPEETSKQTDDFDAELEKEIESYKNNSSGKEFQVVETGVTGCVFIKSASCDPTEIMDRVIETIIETGQCRSRKILRMLPIPVTCKAYLEDINKAIVPLLDKHFKGEAKKYAIVVNRRNNSNILRDELIRSIGLLIRDRSPFHSADLKNPQLTVLVEVLKGVCCLSVAPDYNKRKKYNLIELGLSCQRSKESEADKVLESTDRQESDVPDTDKEVTDKENDKGADNPCDNNSDKNGKED